MADSILKKNGDISVDIMKFIMSLLVVGIHTTPFGFNTWLDLGFGMVTRLCVPFFFIAGAYYFFLKERPLKKYILRLAELYVIWSTIYLPFDIKELRQMSIIEILDRFLWAGNIHALWYLCGTIIGTLIVFALRKFLNDKQTFAVSVGLLIIGCIISTWSPLVSKVTGLDFTGIEDAIGVRNGLFYAPAYISAGMCIAKGTFKKIDNKNCIIGFIASIILLLAGSFFFVVFMKTQYTVLWLSILPASIFLFLFVLNIKIKTDSKIPLLLRKMSTVIFVSHNLFLIILGNYFSNMLLFIFVSIWSVAFAAVVVYLSEKIKILKHLY